MLHKEGKATILITLIGLFALNFAIGFTEINWLINSILFLSVVFLIIILQFFRNPTVTVTQNEKSDKIPISDRIYNTKSLCGNN